MNINKFSVRKSDYWKCSFFIVFWLMPLFYTNLTLKKVQYLPRFITSLYSTSNLFTHATPIWPMLYIQVQEQEGDAWNTLNERDYFPMETFGYRTRLFEAVFLATNIPDYKSRQDNINNELLEWVAQEYQILHGRITKPHSVRIAALFYHVNKNEPPQGRWRVPAISSANAEELYIVKSKVFK